VAGGRAAEGTARHRCVLCREGDVEMAVVVDWRLTSLTWAHGAPAQVKSRIVAPQRRHPVAPCLLHSRQTSNGHDEPAHKPTNQA